MPRKAKTPSPKSEKKVVEKILFTSLSAPELTAKVESLQKDIAKSRLDLSVGRLTNVRRIFNLRKDLARAKTVLHVKITHHEES